MRTSEPAIVRGAAQILMTSHLRQQISPQASQVLELLNNLFELSVLQSFLEEKTAMYK